MDNFRHFRVILYDVLFRFKYFSLLSMKGKKYLKWGGCLRLLRERDAKSHKARNTALAFNTSLSFAYTRDIFVSRVTLEQLETQR